MRLFGENVGIAFQIKDDLFDYTESNLLGKPTGIDIREQKMTLPLIHTLNSVDNKLKNYIIDIIKNHHKNNKKITELITLVKKNGGLEYSEKLMLKYYTKAMKILENFEDNDSRKSLEQLLKYVISRKK